MPGCVVPSVIRGRSRRRLGLGPSESLDRHLPGLAEIAESHFKYVERQLLGVLERSALRPGVRLRVKVDPLGLF